MLVFVFFVFCAFILGNPPEERQFVGQPIVCSLEYQVSVGGGVKYLSVCLASGSFYCITQIHTHTHTHTHSLTHSKPLSCKDVLSICVHSTCYYCCSALPQAPQTLSVPHFSPFLKCCLSVIWKT